MAKNERFKIVYSQGTVDVTQILVDTETGVNYVFRKVAYAGGLTPLLDKDGKLGALSGGMRDCLLGGSADSNGMYGASFRRGASDRYSPCRCRL